MIGSAVNLTTMANPMHSHNSNHHVKGFASRGVVILFSADINPK